MYLEELECSICHKKGRPGDGIFKFSGENGQMFCECDCGNKFTDPLIIDQMILSRNQFTRLTGMSNYYEVGTIMIIPGELTTITFNEKIDILCKVYFTPEKGPMVFKETNATTTGMQVINSKGPGFKHPDESIKVHWIIYGLQNPDSLPTWFMQFYNGVTNLANGLYKTALFDYAVAFEAFVEQYLSQLITTKYDSNAARYLLKQSQKIEERCKGLLHMVTGKKLTDRDDVYTPWHENVRTIRNNLFHGTPLVITQEMAESAHSAVYQAIRFIERECLLN